MCGLLKKLVKLRLALGQARLPLLCLLCLQMGFSHTPGICCPVVRTKPNCWLRVFPPAWRDPRTFGPSGALDH